MFVGLPLCRSKEWLHASLDFTENVFATVASLRLMPTFAHPFLVRFLPSWYHLHDNVKTAKRLLIPLIRDFKAYSATSSSEGDDTVLKWMVDMAADATEADQDKLAERQLMISLASVHTTSMALAHVILDLAAHPEYIPEMKEEVERVLIEGGGISKNTPRNFEKLDSLVRESQRMSPPSFSRSPFRSFW
jgi:ent-kaurene oxidase